MGISDDDTRIALHSGEFKAIQPPSKGREYRRFPSPPPSDHSSNERLAQNNDPSDFLTGRNEMVQRQHLNPDPGIIKARLEMERRHRTMHNWIYKTKSIKSSRQNDKNVKPFQSGTDSATTAGGNEVKQHIPIDPNDCLNIREVALKEIGRFKNKGKSTSFLPVFSYHIFDECRQAPWIIFRLQRIERLLRGEMISKVPSKQRLEQMEKWLHGPIDKHNKMYRVISEQEKEYTSKLTTELLKTEEKMKEWMSYESNKAIAPKYATILRSIRKRLIASLQGVLETNIDMNPFTCPFQAELFLFPRPEQSIHDYYVQPEEYERFQEFISTNSKGICTFEGYNPAVVDIGFEGSKVSNMEDALKLLGKQIDLPKIVGIDILQHLKKELSQYLNGIESTTFVNRFQEGDPVRKHKSSRIRAFEFGQVLSAIPDIIYKQELGQGESKRIIIFPSLLEGSIISAKDILQRYWRRIKYIIEEDGEVELARIPLRYKMTFGESLDPALNWGFESAEEFVKYSCVVLQDDLNDLQLVNINGKDNITVVPEKKNYFEQIMALESSEAASNKSRTSLTNTSFNGSVQENYWVLICSDRQGDFVFETSDDVLC